MSFLAESLLSSFFFLPWTNYFYSYFTTLLAAIESKYIVDQRYAATKFCALSESKFVEGEMETAIKLSEIHFEMLKSSRPVDFLKMGKGWFVDLINQFFLQKFLN